MVDRRGEPQAVIMGVEDYLRNFAGVSEALSEIQRATRKKRVSRLSLAAINLEIRRDRRERRRGRSAGRP